MNESEMNDYALLMETIMQQDALIEMANDTLLQENLAAENARDEAAFRAELRF